MKSKGLLGIELAVALLLGAAATKPAKALDPTCDFYCLTGYSVQHWVEDARRYEVGNPVYCYDYLMAEWAAEQCAGDCYGAYSGAMYECGWW